MQLAHTCCLAHTRARVCAPWRGLFLVWIPILSSVPELQGEWEEYF